MMVVLLVKKICLVVAMDNLDFGVRHVMFEANVLNRYDTFDRIAK
jgi:hypothetical protein